MAELRLKIVTREFKSTFPQYEPNRYVAFFELGGVASLGEGLGTSLDEAIGQLIRVYGHAMGIAVQVPGGKLDEENQEPGTETLARFAELKDTLAPKLQAACEWLLPHFEEAVRDGGDHFEQRFCEEVVKRLRDALAPHV
jgi:hypothetical protein